MLQVLWSQCLSTPLVKNQMVPTRTSYHRAKRRRGCSHWKISSPTTARTRRPSRTVPSSSIRSTLTVSVGRRTSSSALKGEIRIACARKRKDNADQRANVRLTATTPSMHVAIDSDGRRGGRRLYRGRRGGQRRQRRRGPCHGTAATLQITVVTLVAGPGKQMKSRWACCWTDERDISRAFLLDPTTTSCCLGQNGNGKFCPRNDTPQCNKDPTWLPGYCDGRDGPDYRNYALGW